MFSIDFHSHIIPEADHGSDGIATSLWQVNEALSHNVNTVLCTPHFYPHLHNVKAFVKRRDKGFSELMSYTVEKGMSINLIKGAEVLLCDRLDNLPDIAKLCISGTKTLLIELPFTVLHHEYIESVENLIEMGFKVVLAHVDRYPPEDIEKLIECGAALQINCTSLVGLFPRKQLFDWIDRGLVVALGSDIHMKDRKAYKCFASFRKKHPERFAAIMQKCEEFLK